MSLSLTNTSEYLEQTGDTDWWRWTAFVEGSDAKLDEIEYVEYHLVPGFPNPIRRIKNRRTKFALATRGWGVFELIAKVKFKGKQRRQVLRHHLQFEDSEPG